MQAGTCIGAVLMAVGLLFAGCGAPQVEEEQAPLATQEDAINSCFRPGNCGTTGTCVYSYGPTCPMYDLNLCYQEDGACLPKCNYGVPGACGTGYKCCAGYMTQNGTVTPPYCMRTSMDWYCYNPVY